MACFFGDFNGDGAPDAIAFSHLDTDGAQTNLDVSLFRNAAGVMRHVRSVGVAGENPRDVRFANGAVTLTTSYMKPGDRLCCPTGEKYWTVPAR